MKRYTYICCNSDIDLFDPLHDIEISVIADSEYDAVDMVRQELAKICKVNGITDNYGLYNGDVSDIDDTDDQTQLIGLTLKSDNRMWTIKTYQSDNNTFVLVNGFNIKIVGTKTVHAALDTRVITFN